MLRMRVLGSLGAEVGGTPVGLGAPRRRALLADHLYGLELDFRSQLAVLRADHTTAAALIERMLPFRDQLAGAAGAAGTACASRPVAHALGDLHRLLGEDRSAAEHYALAARTAEAWRSPTLPRTPTGRRPAWRRPAPPGPPSCRRGVGVRGRGAYALPAARARRTLVLWLGRTGPRSSRPCSGPSGCSRR
ncbi:hypothetical protein ABZ490_35855 [Streptomyces sp. NPDC005811]|uniref:hypothetical protein n=1 Tax=Streptomyces sp. NPDC005811 TaxID=3154565 RepID=UPI0033C61CA7